MHRLTAHCTGQEDTGMERMPPGVGETAGQAQRGRERPHQSEGKQATKNRRPGVPGWRTCLFLKVKRQEEKEGGTHTRVYSRAQVTRRSRGSLTTTTRVFIIFSALPGSFRNPSPPQ